MPNKDHRVPASDPRTDAQLIADIDRGDSAAFDALYYRYRDWVVCLAHRFTGNSADALDVMQETFIYLLSKFPGLRLSARMTSFLYPVVKNLSISIVRQRNRENPAASTPDVPAPPVVDPQSQRAELAAAMASLSEAHREIILMRFVDDMSVNEIAQALAIPQGTVKSRLHHAIACLRADPRVVK